MGKFWGLLLFLVLFILPTGHSLSQTIEDANVQYNHAQSYYWLSRNRLNSLHEVVTANSHLDSAKQILSKLKTNSQNKTDLRKDIQVLQSELDLMTTISEGNLNGRYPMYMHLTGQNNRQLEFRDDALETCIENALEKLLESITFKPSKPLNELLTFSFIKIIDETPEKSLSKEKINELKEVIRQYLNNNAKFYVASNLEERTVFDDPITLNDSSLKKFRDEFSSNSLGILSVNLYDYSSSIKYCGVQFDYYNAHNGQIISSTYIEDFKEDKNEIKSNFMTQNLWQSFLIFLLISGAFLFFYHGKESFQKIKENAINNLIALGYGISIGPIIGAVVIMLFSLIAPPGDAFIGDPISKIWPLLFAFGLMTLAPSLLFVLNTLLLKRRIIRERYSSFLLMYSILFGIYLTLSFKYYEFFQETTALSLVILSLFLLSLSAHYQCLYFRKYYQSKKSISYLLIPLLHGLLAFPVASLFLYTSNQFMIHTNVMWEGSIVFLLVGTFQFGEWYFNGRKPNEQSTNEHGLSHVLQTIQNQLSDYSTKKIYVPFSQKCIEIFKSLVTKQESDIDIIHLKGISGIGKTAFIESFMRDDDFNAKHNLDWYYGDCDEFKEGDSVPYEPFHQAFSEHIGEGVFFSGNDTAIKVIQGASSLLSVTPVGDLSEHISSSSFETKALPSEVIREIIDYLRKTIIEAQKTNDNQNKQIVFVLDDIHWIDLETRETFELFVDELVKISSFENVFVKLVLIESEHDIVTNNNELTGLLKLLMEKSKKGSVSLTNWGTNEKKSISGVTFNEIRSTHFIETYLTNKNVGCTFDPLSIREILKYAKENDLDSPRNLLEIFKYLLENEYFTEDVELVSLREDQDLRKISWSNQDDHFLHETFRSLNPKLIRILCSASFIGQEFEANVLSDIWKVERMDLLHDLIEAEEKGIITDLNESDDYYAFNSKKIRNALQSFALKKSNHSDNIPQIVLEYHRKIIKFVLGSSELRADAYDQILKMNTDSLIKIGHRAKYLSKSFDKELIYTACVQRLYNEGNFGQAGHFVKMIKEHNEYLKTLYPELTAVRCSLMIKNYDEKRDKNELLKLYDEFSLVLQEETNSKNIKENSLALMNLLELNKLISRFDFEENYPLSKDLKCIITLYKIHQERKANFDKAQEQELISLYEDFASEKSIHPRVRGIYFDTISRLKSIGIEERVKYLKQRLEIIINSDVSGSLNHTFCELNLTELQFQQLEDLAYFSSSLIRLLLDKNETNELTKTHMKRIEINQLINSSFGLYLSRLGHLNHILQGGENKDMVDLLEKYAELIYDYPLIQKLTHIYPRYIEAYLKSDQRENLLDTVLTITNFVNGIFIKNPGECKCFDPSINFDVLKKNIKNKKIQEVLEMIH